MKISFPLSLKVSLWLLLNLLLLAVVGGVTVVKETGFSMDAFVTGSAGSGLQTAANLIATELKADPTHPDDVLAHFGDEYGVEFALFQLQPPSPAGPVSRQAPVLVAVQIAGHPLELPADVEKRLVSEEQLRGRNNPGQDQQFQFNRPPPELRLLSDSKYKKEQGLTDAQFAEILGYLTEINLANWKQSAAQEASINARRNGHIRLEAIMTDAQKNQLDQFFPMEGGSLAPLGESPAPRRFLVHATAPAAAYFAGVQLPRMQLMTPGSALLRTGNVPGVIQNVSATLLMRTTSLGKSGLLFNLSPWLWAAAAAVGLSVLFWLPLVHGITRSLRQLTLATERIAEGHFDTRVDEKRRDEIGRLGGAVNVMAVQLDRAATGQKRFLGDIAHELGSPVGRMQVAVGILETQADQALQPAVADVREEVQQMSGLVGELLAFTKAGLRARDAVLVRVELAALAAEVLAREAVGGKVTVTLPAGLAVAADANLLSRALANLVRNAIRYAGDDGPITLAAHAEGAEVVIAVEDCGPGVPADTLARLGEPFYRPEFARTRETGGAGLGLAIVKSAAEACHGNLRFSNREPRGFRAELRLKLA